MNYTKELYERLTPFRTQLYNACYFDFIRFTSVKEKEELAIIFKLHFKKDSDILKGCTRCLLRDCRLLGKDYFQDEKEYAQLEPKVEVIENQDNNNKITKKDTSNGKRRKRDVGSV
jgi:hypothetical protein